MNVKRKFRIAQENCSKSSSMERFQHLIYTMENFVWSKKPSTPSDALPLKWISAIFLKITRTNQIWRPVDFEHIDDQIHQTSVQCSQSLSCIAKIITNSNMLHALTFQVEIQHHHDHYHRSHPLCLIIISMLQISAPLRIKISRTSSALQNIITIHYYQHPHC